MLRKRLEGRECTSLCAQGSALQDNQPSYCLLILNGRYIVSSFWMSDIVRSFCIQSGAKSSFWIFCSYVTVVRRGGCNIWAGAPIWGQSDPKTNLRSSVKILLPGNIVGILLPFKWRRSNSSIFEARTCLWESVDCEKSNATNGRVRNRLMLAFGRLPVITDRCRHQMESGGIYQRHQIWTVLATFGNSHMIDFGNRWKLGISTQ